MCLQRLHSATAVTFRYSVNRFDVIANIFLFVPFGFLLALLSVPVRSVAMIAGIGLRLSVRIERTQPFMAAHETSLTDLLTNSVGASIGALAAHRLRRSSVATISRKLALALPLMLLA